MTRKRLVCLLAGVVAASVLAGCGGTRTVTKTRIVRALPCDTVKRMQACVVDNASEYARHHDEDPSGIAARCTLNGPSFTCVVLIPNPTPGLCASVEAYASAMLGYLYVGDVTQAAMKVCDEAFAAS